MVQSGATDLSFCVAFPSRTGVHTFQQERFLLLGCVLVMGASLCTIKQRTLLGWMHSMCYAIKNVYHLLPAVRKNPTFM